MKDIEGMILFLGDNVDTDAIIPGPYLRTLDYCEMASHVFEGISPDVSKYARDCSIVVAGDNFGCGSSREQAAIAIKFSGIQCVLARSFARIFYRNAINLGLTVMEYDGYFEPPEGDIFGKVDPEEMFLEIENTRIGLEPIPMFAKDIIEQGGIVDWFRNKHCD